jgi:hypothetical protein
MATVFILEEYKSPIINPLNKEEVYLYSKNYLIILD